MFQIKFTFQRHFYYLTVIILILASSVSSLKCYNCEGCSDPFNNNTNQLTECGVGYKTCAVCL